MDKKITRHNVKCSVCNKFCKSDEDFSVLFAKDNFKAGLKKYFCESCAKKSEKESVDNGYVRNHYTKSQWEKRAAEKLGLVETQCKWADFTFWRKSNG
jgi:uncharacterized protein YlaI